MAVRIRMKKLGRKHRPVLSNLCHGHPPPPRRPRAGGVGYVRPLDPDTDARAVLNGERIAYWLSVGATPSDKVSVLIKKYGAGGTHVAVQQAALDALAQSRRRPEPMQPLPRAEKPAKPANEEAPAKAKRKSAIDEARDEAAAKEDQS